MPHQQRSKLPQPPDHNPFPPSGQFGPYSSHFPNQYPMMLGPMSQRQEHFVYGHGAMQPNHGEMVHGNSPRNKAYGSKTKANSMEENGSTSQSSTATSQGSRSHDTDEEAAATALLIAAGGSRNEDFEAARREEVEAVMRKKQRVMTQDVQGQEVYHISPNSTDVNRETIEVEDEDEDNASAGDETQFPNVLHEVLTDSEHSGKVLEWLSHGKSWRVLRWDEMCETVIPKYFPELCVTAKVSEKVMVEATISERMNSFINLLQAWGFVEVKEVGPDMGSYQHEFFMKIAPNLKRHMKLKVENKRSQTDHNDISEKGRKIVSPPRRGPKGRFSMHSAPALNPGFNATTPVAQFIHGGRRVTPSTASMTHKRKLFIDNREEMEDVASSPGSRSGPRCVSFQERMEGDDSSVHSIQRQHRIMFESPKPQQELSVNYVSPNTKPHWLGHSDAPRTPRLSVRSNRGGGSRSKQTAFGHIIDYRDGKSSPSMPQHGWSKFPVSSRGRGNRNISTRGRGRITGIMNRNRGKHNIDTEGNQA
mmetsp:Transcript_8931/g.11245  ORF Transcript_8931/g.11245 Transcript_8931/m.11245 type:complete len:534 (+) Transcript_8931:671-2272(+)